MSLPQDLQPVQLLSSKYDFKTALQIGSRVGNESRSRIKYSPINQTDITGPQSQTWQITNESFFDSNVKMEVTYSFKVSGLKADGTTAVAMPVANVKSAFNDRFGLASFAYNRCIQNVSVKLNNSAMLTTNVADTLDAFIMGENPDYLATLSPVSKIDNYYKYSTTDLASVLRTGTNVPNVIDSRGVGTTYDITFSQSGNDTVVTITIQEAIIARPFQYADKSSRNPFFNISDMQMIINYESDLSKFIKFNEALYQNASSAPYGTIADLASVNFNSFKITPKLIIDSFTPQIQVPRPSRCFYNCPIINTFKAKQIDLPASGVGVTNNSEKNQQFTNYVINGIPKLFIVYVKAVKISTAGVTLQNRGDAFARLDKVVFSFGNKVNQFTDLELLDLYDMSIKNGYNQRFSVWSGLNVTKGAAVNTGSGSFFFFRAEDLNLNSTEMSNIGGAYNIQLTIDYTNTHSDKLTFEPTLCCVYDNIMMYDNGRFSDFKPLMTPDEVLNGRMEFMNDDRVMNSIMGGSWWSDAWSTVKKVITNPVTKEISKFARNTPWLSKHLGDDTQVGKFLGKHGYGKHGEHEHEEHGGNSRSMYGRTHTHSNKGGSSMVIGGKRLSKKQLLDML